LTTLSTPTVTTLTPTTGFHTQVLDLIRSATQSIHITVYSITDPAIIQALVTLHTNVKLTVFVDRNATEIKHLARALLSRPNTRLLTKTHHKIHAKLIVVDAHTTWTGSLNWSKSALHRSYETAVIIRDPATAEAHLQSLRHLEGECEPLAIRPPKAKSRRRRRRGHRPTPRQH